VRRRADDIECCTAIDDIPRYALFSSMTRELPIPLLRVNKSPPVSSLHMVDSSQDEQCTHKRNIEARSRNLCCHEKALSVTYSAYVPVALVIQHAKRMRLLY